MQNLSETDMLYECMESERGQGRRPNVHVGRDILLWSLAGPLLPTDGYQRTRQYRLGGQSVKGCRCSADFHEQIAISTAADVMDTRRSARSSPQ